MNCENIKELLSSYIDKELAADDTDLVKAHLDGCPECTETLEQLKGIVNMVGAIPRLTLSPSAADRLSSALAKQIKTGERKERRKKGEWRRWFTQPAFGYVAASMAVLAIAVVIWSSPSEYSAQKKLRSPAPLMEAPSTGSEQELEGKTSAPPEMKDFTREEIDELAGNESLSSSPEASKEAPGAFGFMEQNDSADSALIDAGEAASVAAGGSTAQLISSTKGIFEGTRAWIIVIELDDPPGQLVGAAISVDGGKLLYRK